MDHLSLSLGLIFIYLVYLCCWAPHISLPHLTVCPSFQPPPSFFSLLSIYSSWLLVSLLLLQLFVVQKHFSLQPKRNIEFNSRLTCTLIGHETTCWVHLKCFKNNSICQIIWMKLWMSKIARQVSSTGQRDATVAAVGRRLKGTVAMLPVATTTGQAASAGRARGWHSTTHGSPLWPWGGMATRVLFYICVSIDLLSAQSLGPPIFHLTRSRLLYSCGWRRWRIKVVPATISTLPKLSRWVFLSIFVFFLWPPLFYRR